MEVSDGDERVTLVRLEARDEDEDDADEVGDAPPSPPRDPPSPREVGTRSGAAAASPAARVAVLVPFREDGTGRAAQLSSLLARLATLFPDPDQCVVVVAEQSADGRKFNRGQLLNVAFAHLRASRPEWISGDTLYCFHDCDMLPAPSLAHHYLRPRPLLPESERTPLGPFVRVLTAAGSRYDHDACFGGVTLYDAPGFLATNGYPNGFWGWGGEDNAQFLRCARARLWLERVHRCAFDDLEGLDTVEEKLAALDVAGARCAAKDKRRLLRRNAAGDAWTRDGLADVRFEIEGDEIQLGGDSNSDTNDGSSPSPRAFVSSRGSSRGDGTSCVASSAAAQRTGRIRRVTVSNGDVLGEKTKHRRATKENSDGVVGTNGGRRRERRRSRRRERGEAGTESSPGRKRARGVWSAWQRIRGLWRREGTPR